MNRPTPAALAAPTMDSAADLTPFEAAVLEFERLHFPRPGEKERAIQDAFHVSPTRYFQIVNAMIDDPRLVYRDPVLVNRLRRVRTVRRAAR